MNTPAKADLAPAPAPVALAPVRAPTARLTGTRPQTSGTLGGRFWRLFGANGVSALGDGLVMVAFPLLAVTKTSNALLIAGVAIAGRLPALLLAVPAGALADRVNRRRFLFSINLLQAVVLAALSAAVVTGDDTLVAIYAAAFAVGAGDFAFDVTAQASLPGMVARPDLSRANGYLAAADFSGEQFAGPAVGGFLFAAARSVPFIGDAVSFAVSAVLARSALPPGGPRTEARTARVRSDIRAGLQWFWAHRLLRLVAMVVAMLAFCQAMVLAELVLYGLHDLHLTRSGYGLAFAGMAAGNIVGSLAASRIRAHLSAFQSIAAAALIAGLAYLVLASTAVVAVAVASMFMEAVAVAVGNVTTLTLRQEVIPADLLGRVGSVFRMSIFGFIPLGALAGGIVAATTSVRWAFAVAGILQLTVFLAVSPVLRRRLVELGG